MKALLPCLAAATFTGSTLAAPPPETAKTNTLQAIWSEPMPDIHVLEYTGRQKTLGAEYIRQFERDGSTIIDDRIGLRTDYQWFTQSTRQGYDWNETRSHIGGRAMRSVIASQFRDAYALTGSSPLFRTLNSNGERDSQSLSPYSIRQALIGSDYWIDHHPYGWIPHPNWDLLSTRPDLSLESNIGRQPGGLPLMNVSLHCWSDFESIDDFARIGAGGRIIIPVDHLFQVTIGGSLNPLERDSHWTSTVRIDRYVGPTLISLGARKSESRTQAIFQVSISY